MILSTLHMTTCATPDLHGLRDTIDFSPLINLKMLSAFPIEPFIFIGVYPKTTVQGWSYKNIWCSHLPQRKSTEDYR